MRIDDPNRNVIIETLAHYGARTVMAQRFIPEIVDGDKRIVLIDGKPIPHVLARIPKAGETRAISPPAAWALRARSPRAIARSPTASAPSLRPRDCSWSGSTS